MAQIFTTFEDVQYQNSGKIELRKEQLEAIKDAKNRFKQKAGNKFLWNAKMRFGKTVCALQLAKELGYRRILIVTHRPTVNKEWLEAYEERFADVISQYSYGTKSDTQSEGTDFNTLKNKINESETFHFLFFASMQYLRRSNLVGGDNNEQLKKDIMTYDWDLVIVDEAHEGTRTELGQKVLEYLEHKTNLAKDEKDTRTLHLSGTPFNLYDDFENNEIYTWDYVDEQTAKKSWPRDEKEKKDQEEGKSNPYAVLPHMNILTFSLASDFDKFKEKGGTFKFREFFRTKTGSDIPEEERGKFIHEEEVREFIVKLRGKDDNNNFPFSNDEFRKAFRHTLWIVPGVKEAKALKTLLEKDKVFKNFKVVNVAGNNDDEQKDSALDSVLSAITDQPDQTRTITLSCGKLTTGTTVKPWTAVLYLKGSEDTKAATYLQTIFRVQSPCTGADYPCFTGRMKKECYVFDFDYQRTLKVVAETAKYSTIAKKASNKEDVQELTQDEQDKKNMQAFLDCCNVKPLVPFIEDGAVMTEFGVESIFKRLEAVYVDRLVTSGFNDKCLYDMTELNKIDKSLIDNIGEHGGAADHIEGDKRVKGVGNSIDVNNLTDEQKEVIEEAKKKLRKEMEEKRKEKWNALTQEQQDKILEERARRAMERKEFKDRVSNIRGISLRIPLLMFGGADKDDAKTPLTVDNFTKLITDESWNEFMPKGITKDDFNKIRKVFNATRFKEAGRKYRALAEEADDLHIDDRIERITTIHSWFKNPDKETVLTPWPVVNMHLHTALGGYSFFDPQDYKSRVMKDVAIKDENGNEVIDKNGNVRTESIEVLVTDQPTCREEITDKVFGVYDRGKDAIQTKILEINSKTGLYPLYMAYNLYRLQMDVYIRENVYDDVENLSVKEEQATWDNVIKNNIFVICNTKMAAQITYRTLMGFRDEDKCPHHIKTTKLVERALNDTERNNLIAELRSGEFWGINDITMKFNSIVGNPPYQQGGNNNPIYHLFIGIAKKLNPSCISLITPSRWFAGGRRELTSFRQDMANDTHIRSVVNFINGKEVFPTSSTGSVNFFVWDREYEGDCTFTSILQGKSRTTNRRLNEFISTNVVVGNNIALDIVRKIMVKKESKFSDNVKPYMPFGLRSYERGQKVQTVNHIALYTSDGVFYRDRNEIPEGHDYIDCYKLLTSKLLAEHAGEPDKSGRYKVLSRTEIIEPNSACTESYLILSASKEKAVIENCFSYCTTKFFRFLLLQAMSSINMTSDVFVFVPNQDFSKSWTDEELYSKYELTKEEIDTIESLIKPF